MQSFQGKGWGVRMGKGDWGRSSSCFSILCNWLIFENFTSLLPSLLLMCNRRSLHCLSFSRLSRHTASDLPDQTAESLDCSPHKCSRGHTSWSLTPLPTALPTAHQWCQPWPPSWKPRLQVWEVLTWYLGYRQEIGSKQCEYGRYRVNKSSASYLAFPEKGKIRRFVVK